MTTRAGEPVVVKLAQDIHIIIEVTEDGDCKVLKPLISAAKTRKPSTNGHNERRTTTSVFIPCTCAAEFPILRDTILTMQAEILLLKQTQHAQEKIRSEQMSTTKTVLENIKKDLLLCNQDVKQCVFNSRDSVYSISSSLCRNILQLEDRIRVM